MTRYDSLRLIIALATYLGLDTDQLDIKSAFLQGDLVEEMWMVPPPGIGLDEKILGLDKALYGLKQAPLAWFEKLSEALAEIAFISLPVSGAIGDLVITSNYRGEYMSCEEYITEITTSGVIACWITA